MGKNIKQKLSVLLCTVAFYVAANTYAMELDLSKDDAEQKGSDATHMEFSRCTTYFTVGDLRHGIPDMSKPCSRAANKLLSISEGLCPWVEQLQLCKEGERERKCILFDRRLRPKEAALLVREVYSDAISGHKELKKSSDPKEFAINASKWSRRLIEGERHVDAYAVAKAAMYLDAIPRCRAIFNLSSIIPSDKQLTWSSRLKDHKVVSCREAIDYLQAMYSPETMETVTRGRGVFVEDLSIYDEESPDKSEFHVDVAPISAAIKALRIARREYKEGKKGENARSR